MSMERSAFRQHGARMDGEFFNWASSYVEYEGGPHFCPENVKDKKSTHLAYNNAFVQPNELFFTGNRQFNCDAPIYISGIDVIRFPESDYCKTADYSALLEDPQEIEEALSKYLKEHCRGDLERLLSIDGFYAMSLEAKQMYVQQAGFEDVDESRLSKKMALEGISAVACGGFPDKQQVISFIESNGGECTLEKKAKQLVTHVILGTSGTTRYGGKTGLGSKKFNVAKKGGARVVDMEFMRQLVASGEDWRAEHEEFAAAQEAEKQEQKRKRVEKKAANLAKKAAAPKEPAALPRRSKRARK